MAPSRLSRRAPRLCAALPPRPLTLPDRDAVGAGLLVSLAGCGFDGQPCVGLKIREENRDVRIRRARGLEAEGEAAGRARGTLQRTGVTVRRGIIGDDAAFIDGKSRIALFGFVVSICGLFSVLSSVSPR